MCLTKRREIKTKHCGQHREIVNMVEVVNVVSSQCEGGQCRRWSMWEIVTVEVGQHGWKVNVRNGQCGR